MAAVSGAPGDTMLAVELGMVLREPDGPLSELGQLLEHFVGEDAARAQREQPTIERTLSRVAEPSGKRSRS